MRTDADATSGKKKKFDPMKEVPKPVSRDQRDLLHEQEEEYMLMEKWAASGFVSGHEVLN